MYYYTQIVPMYYFNNTDVEAYAMKKGKQLTGKIVFAVGLLLAAAIYYYITIPAINIHSTGMWAFMIGLVLMIGCAVAVRKLKKSGHMRFTKNGLDIDPGHI